MPIQSVLKMGNKNLTCPSLPIQEFATASLYTLIQNMQDTMQEKKGVGIAAPQIGCNQRIILFGFEQNARYPHENPVPLTILINPIIEIVDYTLVDGWEGCLSVPGLRGLVARYQKIKYSAYSAEGEKITNVVEGFHARIIQHECDHLDGVLFPQRIKDLRFFGFEDELQY